MIQKLYYVVEKELQDVDGFEEVTGNKLIKVYTIGDNGLTGFFNLQLNNSDNTEEEINDYMNENVNEMFYTDGYKLIRL